jgi:Flp pilus assembly pilin Flp
MHRDTYEDAAPQGEEAGQTMVEYAVVLAVITLAIVLSIQLLGNTAGGMMQELADKI